MTQQCAGIRTDPPISVPSSKAVNPHATAAAGPPEEPPGIRSSDHGLLVVPKMSLNVCTSPAHRGTFVLPNTTAPAALSRATEGASTAGMWLLNSLAPPVERTSATSIASL